VLGAYGFEPLNFTIRFVGILDDFIFLPMALHWLLNRLPTAIRARFAATASILLR
jgi:hypothetical protein